MAKTAPLGVRFSAETKAALDKAAKDEARSLSNLIERIVSDWLKQNSYLDAEPPRGNVQVASAEVLKRKRP